MHNLGQKLREFLDASKGENSNFRKIGYYIIEWSNINIIYTKFQLSNPQFGFRKFVFSENSRFATVFANCDRYFSSIKVSVCFAETKHQIPMALSVPPPLLFLKLLRHFFVSNVSGGSCLTSYF